MKDLIPDHIQELENMTDDEKLDHAFHEMEMLYRSRCVDAPIATNVKVVEVKKDEETSGKKA